MSSLHRARRAAGSTWLILMSFGLGVSDAYAVTNEEWSFKVLLDGDPIGYHQFKLREAEAGRELYSEANFNVKVLFLTAYHYRHTNRERWVGNCVQEVTARTDDNGKAWSVQGVRKSGEFLVETNRGSMMLPECVMTFAYWNPEILQQDRLLNMQTGEYVDISVSALGREPVKVGGGSVQANSFLIDADELTIKLWYSDTGRWIALETVTESGKTLRYRMDDHGVAFAQRERCDGLTPEDRPIGGPASNQLNGLGVGCEGRGS